ncbi:hypothetical protein RHS03_00380, partial [Rhizoctonia solani]
MSFSQDYYCYPIFTSYRNDVPLTPELGIIEASHVCNLYYVYANRHNDHYSPYSENHPDPLECCIHTMPDIEVFLMDDDHPPQWFLGVDFTHTLHRAYTHALCVFGKAVQPAGWNCRKPWVNYNYATELVKIGFPYILRPICFKEDVYHFPTNSFHKLQQQVHHNNFYAICLNALSIIITATKQMEYSNIAHVGYICGSPACVLAHCFWCCLHGHLVVEHSKDNLSNAGFPVNRYNGNNKALRPITPLPENVLLPQLVDFAENGNLFMALEYALLHATNKAGKFPALEYAHSHKFDIAALTQQLALVAVAQSVESVSPGFGNNFVASVWEWLGEPNPVVDLGPPEWPMVLQQHTQPFLWEDHWHEVHTCNLELGNNQDVDIGGGLKIDLEHIICPLPVVTN